MQKKRTNQIQVKVEQIQKNRQISNKYSKYNKKNRQNFGINTNIAIKNLKYKPKVTKAKIIIIWYPIFLNLFIFY